MEIDLGKLPFDLDFHPSSPLVTVGLITGDLQLYRYAAIGTQPEKVFEIHAHEEFCRAVHFINGCTAILTTSPDFSILATDVQTGATIAHLDNAHEAAVNRLVNLTETIIAP
ncbi:hypothetical protein IFM89_030230 [Coptis chinensis]|uniref:Uncharacterized protein n=1 Tax=Coptis chinensis TaxID=261450 RepID=A0A835HYV7_9MAGN|nr:hypothetical protein IFM89_030230 [Coptis chinensis]